MKAIEKNLKRAVVHVSQSYLGQHPTTRERLAIIDIGRRATLIYSDEYEYIFRKLYTCAGLKGPYMSVTKAWKHIGFQHEDPVSDIRGGGILSLDNLLYFMETHTKFVQAMISSRSNRNITHDNRYVSFPWAAAGINLSRMLAAQFEAVDQYGRANTQTFSRKTYWSYLLHRDGFNRLFVLAFLLLDCVWDEMGASYMEFNEVLAAVADEFTSMLALSSSLPQLEDWIHDRVQYGYFGDYNYYSLPDSNDQDIENSNAADSKSINKHNSSDRLDTDIETGSHAVHTANMNAPIDYLSSDFKMTYSNTPQSEHLNYMQQESSLRRRHVYHVV